MALLAIASRWAREHGRRLVAITIDHGLNPASPDWSRFCARAASAAGADWVERRWDGLKPATGLTAAARAARHALIAEAARDADARVVLFAHTADDIAEADWMREHGSTLGRLREWSPSPAWPEGRGVMLLRPMLEVPREVLRDYLRAERLKWIEDPGNADVRFGRSRARRELLQAPLIPAKARARTFPSPLAGAVERDGWQWWGGRTLGPRLRGDERSVSDPVGLGPAIVSVAGATEIPKHERLARLADALSSGQPLTATLSGARIVADDIGVLIAREAGDLKRRPVPDIALIPDVPAVWDGRFEIIAREAGWRVTAAAGRLNQLSKADRAIAKTVPAWTRGALPVLIRDDGTAPVLAWRKAEVRSLAPRRLHLALMALGGETTQEADLFRAIHGETPPSDLFSLQEYNNGVAQGASRDREP